MWATCLFADPIADIAVLGQPDNQALSDAAGTAIGIVSVGRRDLHKASLQKADAPKQQSPPTPPPN